MTRPTEERGGVVAGAVASTADSASRAVRGGSRATLDGTLTPSAASAPRQHHADLSPRDWQILRTVQTHRFATTNQLLELHFAGVAPTARGSIGRRVLARLRRLGLLAVLERRVGGIRAGSTGLVHHLTSKGDRLLRVDSDHARRRFHEPSPAFLRHILAVGQVHIDLASASRQDLLEPVDLQIETAAWRRYTDRFTATVLKPDLYCEIAVPPGSDELLTAFVEVDLGTEHVPTTLRRKCRQYAAYASSPEAADTGMPLVIWSLDSRDPAIAARRRERLRQVIASDPKLDPHMFRITEPKQLIATLHEAAMQKGDPL